MADARMLVAPGFALAACCAAAMLAGCSQQSITSAGVLQVPDDWTVLSGSDIAAETNVPGDALGGWRSAGGSTLLIVSATLPASGATAQSIGEELANRLQNLAEVEGVSHGISTQHGVDIARVEAVAPGNGRSWALTSLGSIRRNGAHLVPTRMIAVGCPRADATYWITAYFPEERRAGLQPFVDEIVQSWDPTRLRRY